MNVELKCKLEELARLKSVPFCYGCYREAQTGRCESCGSDDLMRLLRGVGCEYGTDWVVRELVGRVDSPIDLDEEYERFLSEMYPEPVSICGVEFDPAWAFKQLDPIAFELAQSEWLDSLVDDGVVLSVDGEATYSWTDDLAAWVDGELAAVGPETA